MRIAQYHSNKEAEVYTACCDPNFNNFHKMCNYYFNLKAFNTVCHTNKHIGTDVNKCCYTGSFSSDHPQENETKNEWLDTTATVQCTSIASHVTSTLLARKN